MTARATTCPFPATADTMWSALFPTGAVLSAMAFPLVSPPSPLPSSFPPAGSLGSFGPLSAPCPSPGVAVQYRRALLLQLVGYSERNGAGLRVESEDYSSRL